MFVDESGDLGFDIHSSKFFVVSFVMIINTTSTRLEVLIKRALKNINIAKRRRWLISEFKFSNDSDKTKRKFLKKINSYDVQIGAVAISKDSVKTHLQKEPNLLYNYAVIDFVMKTIVDEYLVTQDPYNRIIFIIDRSLSAKSRKNFNDYAEEKAKFLTHKRNWKMDVIVSIRHEDSEQEKLLQVADYVSGSIFHKLERNNPVYYEMIQTKITHKFQWDWHGKIVW